jgi:hypothetical protein
MLHCLFAQFVGNVEAKRWGGTVGLGVVPPTQYSSYQHFLSPVRGSIISSVLHPSEVNSPQQLPCTFTVTD